MVGETCDNVEKGWKVMDKGGRTFVDGLLSNPLFMLRGMENSLVWLFV